MYGTCGCERRQMFVCDAGIHVSRNFSSRVSREPKGNRRVRSEECPAAPHPPIFLERCTKLVYGLWSHHNHIIYRTACFEMARGKQETVVRHLSSAYCALNFGFQRSPSNLYSLKKNSLVFLTVRKYIMGSSLGHHFL